MLDDSPKFDEGRSESLTSTERGTHDRGSSRPVAGRSLGAIVTAIEPPVRNAVGILSGGLSVPADIEDLVFGCTRYGPGAVVESAESRMAWAVVAITLIHARFLSLDRPGNIEGALSWFSGDQNFVSALLRCARPRVWCDADAELAYLRTGDGLWDLLPYVLEPHGHVTRSRLETCEVSRATRLAKKSSGVFYTPSDVAEFLVKAAASQSRVTGTWLDPACGTGVFLRAILDRAREQAAPNQFNGLAFARRSLFGADLSAQATDLTCFVLLADCGPRAAMGSPPINAWRALKVNIICADTLRISPPGRHFQADLVGDGLVQLQTLFVAVAADGFDHVIINPPYVSVTFGAEVGRSWASFSAKGNSSTADAQTAFTEMLWRFTRPGGGGAAVLPLSIGTNTSTAYCALRRDLASIDGFKDFLFFDREPQALFGEDVKTRNAILIFRHGQPGENVVRTSRLLKWTGKQRDKVFQTDRLIPIVGVPYERFVPKLGSLTESSVYRQLYAIGSSHALPSHRLTFGRSAIIDAVGTSSRRSPRSILVSATAYNFLNVFLACGLPDRTQYPFSSSPLNEVGVTNSETAYAAIAIIASRLAFWMWHVEGDGFHVTIDFLKRLPMWNALNNNDARKQLTVLGRQFWSAARAQRVDSVNGGKQTSSFHTGYQHPIYQEVDDLLLETLGIGHEASRFLDDFIEATVSVDGSRRDRELIE